MSDTILDFRDTRDLANDIQFCEALNQLERERQRIYFDTAGVVDMLLGWDALMDVDAQDPLQSVAAVGDVVRVLGAGRGGKPRDELVKGSALAAHMGKRARKGAKVEAVLKPSQVLPG